MLSQFAEEEDDYHNQPIDKQRVPPLHQKRLLAFVNHFIVETVDFLNRLIADVDLKFVRYETKLRKVEDSLAILESKLSSIPDLQPIKSHTSDSIINNPEKTSTESDQIKQDITEPPAVNSQVGEKPEIETFKEEDTEKVVVAAGIKASEDYRYKKYFKMIHYGAHPQAVKNKVASEGLDPSILDNANQILMDGQRTPPPESDSSEAEDSS